jgi:hypothetical protein
MGGASDGAVDDFANIMATQPYIRFCSDRKNKTGMARKLSERRAYPFSDLKSGKLTANHFFLA